VTPDTEIMEMNLRQPMLKFSVVWWVWVGPCLQAQAKEISDIFSVGVPQARMESLQSMST
jgi:hypothetical protein